MPAPEPDFIVAPAAPPISVALEPAHNALNSLLLLVKADELSGLDTWVTRTAAALTPEQRHINHLILIGVHFAVVPDRSFPSFPAYVDHLASLDPITLRNRVFNAYAQVTKEKEKCCPPPDPTSDQVAIDVAPLLQDVDVFLEFLKQRFPVDHLNIEIESEAHTYLNDPPAMQALIVSHFRSMWEQFLSPEWDRVVPMLQASVDAFRQISLGDLSRFEAAQRVLGRDMGKVEQEYWQVALERTERLILQRQGFLLSFLRDAPDRGHSPRRQRNVAHPLAFFSRSMSFQLAGRSTAATNTFNRSPMTKGVKPRGSALFQPTTGASRSRPGT